ncbi:SDR family NAD(P)-dependent oxidoreductase [Nocardia alba]|uniref:Short subunit dehydrogenase n=1 Tax=Nocardia alba TaxID=225051 RepID=A0A4R1FYW0_9NOCA|nr:SDR family oxidoreductase [Nocardia alba]TCK00927.1 short subunit dehydrogenase [Nocardia alba]
MSTLAIFGYGPGLGAGTARAFGRNGFRVAVIGRDLDRAEQRAAALRAEGIEVAPFAADITESGRLTEVIARVEGELGPIDVAVHAAAAGMSIRSATTRDVDRAALELPFALKVYSSIELSRALLPTMIERGSGTLLFSSGASEENLQPYLANVGVALGAQRAFVRQLAAEVEGTGVYVGLLGIGALIEHSAVQLEIDAHPELIPEGVALPRIGNDELGARYWRMYTERDTVEVEIGF